MCGLEVFRDEVVARMLRAVWVGRDSSGAFDCVCRRSATDFAQDDGFSYVGCDQRGAT